MEKIYRAKFEFESEPQLEQFLKFISDAYDNNELGIDGEWVWSSEMAIIYWSEDNDND